MSLLSASSCTRRSGLSVWTRQTRNITTETSLVAYCTNNRYVLRSFLPSNAFRYDGARRWMSGVNKKQKRKDGKRQRASDRRREKADRNAKLLSSTEVTISKAERIAKEGVPDLSAMFWLALFPLLAAGAAVAFIPDFRETLFGTHEEANTFEMKTRPLSVPGGGKKESTAPRVEEKVEGNAGSHDAASS